MSEPDPTRYLIVDTETSGLFDFSKPADADGQPRLCGITMIPVIGNEPQLDDSRTTLIKPDGWTISAEITAINGLTTERCEAEGRPVALVLEDYSALVLSGHIVVAYNAQFDTKIMRAELRRAGMPDLFEQTPNICCMRACRGLNVAKANGKKGQPTLADACRHFIGASSPEQHNSLADATSCLMLFLKLQERNLLPAPQVHYAKNRPEA